MVFSTKISNLKLEFKTKNSTDAIYKQEITSLKEKFIKNGYPKKFVDDVIERSINSSKECTNEKLNSLNFKNILKVTYIGKPSIEYRNKLTSKQLY